MRSANESRALRPCHMIARYNVLNNRSAQTGSQCLALTHVVHGCLTITAKAYVLVAKYPLTHSMYIGLQVDKQHLQLPGWLCTYV